MVSDTRSEISRLETQLRREQEGYVLALAQAEIRYEKLLELVEQKDAELADIRRSRSWRATAFLRKVSLFIRR